jgi:superfamily II DNA or RNA helicase/Holliday junction resolvase
MIPRFLDVRRLRDGPWQAFERDVARLFLVNGFTNVRIVGGSGDKGADVLASREGKLWVVQCKYTSNSPPPISAVDEVLEAGRYYVADKLALAVSRPASDAMLARITRERSLGVDVELFQPGALLEFAQNSPEYPPSSRTLHDYQQDAVKRLTESLKAIGKGQVVLATGLGKTVVMAETVASLARDGSLPNGRVLVLAHTRPLVDQLIQAFWYQLPAAIHTHRLSDGEIPPYWDGVTFATIQSVISRLDALPAFDLVLIDEAHHIGADSFLKALDGLKAPMVGGVTATPWRGDGFDIDAVLGPPLVRIGIAEGLARKFLSEVDYRLLADNVDWEFVQELSTHSYSLSQLNRRLILPTRDEEAVKVISRVFREEGRRGGIVYCPSGAHAKEFAARLRQFDLRAEAVLHDLAPRERELNLGRFRTGALDFVCTVDLLNEGVDVPDVDMIVFMRATHSRRIFVQQLGRGLRISATKNKVVVLDFVTDLRRIAEVVMLDTAAKGEGIEHLALGNRIVAFSDQSAGSFLNEWILDQADLMNREGDPALELPRLNFPPSQGAIQ